MVHVCPQFCHFWNYMPKNRMYTLYLAFAVSWQVIIRAGMSHDALDLPLLLETWLSPHSMLLKWTNFLSPLLHYWSTCLTAFFNRFFVGFCCTTGVVSVDQSTSESLFSGCRGNLRPELGWFFLLFSRFVALCDRKVLGIIATPLQAGIPRQQTGMKHRNHDIMNHESWSRSVTLQYFRRISWCKLGIRYTYRRSLLSLSSYAEIAQ